jgi:hypothetical protein
LDQDALGDQSLEQPANVTDVVPSLLGHGLDRPSGTSALDVATIRHGEEDDLAPTTGRSISSVVVLHKADDDTAQDVGV